MARTTTRRRNDGLDLKSLIRENYRSLPENQRKVADYLLQHRQEIPFLTISALELRSGASKATIVRMSRNLGFSGFLDLRAKLLEGVQSQYQVPELFHVPPAADDEETLIAIAHQDVRNINQTVNHLDREAFDHTIRMIGKAAHVHTVGLGISSLLSQILAYGLNQVGVKATAFIHDRETFMEQLPFVASTDLLFAFSFPPYSRETVDLVKAAAAKKVPIIGITDKVTSPISYSCVHVLPIRSQNRLFMNSISAISVVINALVTEVALRNRSKALKFVKNTERQLHDSGHYTSE